LGSNSLQLATQITRPSIDAYLQLANEESLKATLELYAEQPLNVELGELAASPTAFALIDGDKSRLLEWSSVQPMYEVGEGESMWLLRTDRAEGTSIPNSEADWQVALTHHEAGSEESVGRIHALRRDGAYRHLVSLLDAVRSLRESDNGTAIEALDTAIGFSADDALLWWLKALVLRLSGEEAEERPELPNAHFLSPLEPVLRAEAFLAQPQTHAKEGSPLIKPMANNPEAMIEVAVLLLESGLRMEASRWIDECLRHRNEPMLQYLAAWNLMTASRMEAEAAQHVRNVAQAGWEPPFPWRYLERRAIRELAELFSTDERLQKLKALVEAF
jgi:hypothetical protein